MECSSTGFGAFLTHFSAGISQFIIETLQFLHLSDKLTLFLFRQYHIHTCKPLLVNYMCTYTYVYTCTCTSTVYMHTQQYMTHHPSSQGWHPMSYSSCVCLYRSGVVCWFWVSFFLLFLYDCLTRILCSYIVCYTHVFTCTCTCTHVHQ